MTLFYNESFKIGILLLFAIFLSFLLIFISHAFSTFNPDAEKVSAYECGFDPYEDARNTFDVRFYLVAILFIIFDLEVSYLFPWSRNNTRRLAFSPDDKTKFKSLKLSC